MPECLAKMAWLLMSLRSREERCGQALGPASPPPLLLWPQRLTLHNVQDQAWVLVGMEEDHVAQRAICERWAQHGDVVLAEGRTVVGVSTQCRHSLPLPGSRQGA